jgi:uncharacterized protein with ParB-like and HNH nuclease domain
MKSNEEKEIAEQQIIEEKEPVSYDTREYPVEVLIKKFEEDEFFIPNYQRAFVWEKDKEKMSKFIESIILDLPIPYLFFADDLETGKLEIIDGSQRIRTLRSYYKNEFALEGLDILDALNGFYFSDLIESRQRRFLRKTLRSIELTERASADIRRDLFARINTKPYDLLPMEVRKGTFDGEFYNFINRCSESEIFIQLCPISKEREKRGERQELILRYFAYCERYQNFVHRVDDFLDEFMKDKHTNGFEKNSMQTEYEQMLAFVQAYFPNGFKKNQTSKSTPRVRFEALSVGVTLALRESPNLVPNNIEAWINSPEFKHHTTSDASNSRAKVIGRIEFVRDKLLGH